MPWAPELFTAPAQQELLDRRRWERIVSVPFFDGLRAGEPDALVDSFAGEPELYDPMRGRIKGVEAFREFVAEASAWLVRHDVSVVDVERVILEQRGFEEVVLHFDGIELPWALVADHAADGRIGEMRIYHSSRPLIGNTEDRPPLLQRDPELHAPDAVGDYQRALAAGNVDAIVAAFEPDGCLREPLGTQSVHTGRDALRAFYGRLSSTGGTSLEACVAVDDGRTCALEYNVVRPGAAPQAGAAVCVRGQTGRLAAVRVYDDAALSLEI
jgi:hypothetical protein